MVGSMISFTELPLSFWGYALETVARLDALLLEESSGAHKSKSGVIDRHDNDPKTYGEVMSEIDLRKWLGTMKSEMDSMSSSQVWTLVDQPKGLKPIGCKLVHKHKLRANRKATTFKMYIKAAFLNGFVEEKIYMDQLEGFTIIREEEKVLRRTKDMFFVYGGRELILEGYNDASFYFDDDDAKSQSKFVFKLNYDVVA
ncbi:hypothetical protein Sango_1056600 [Sesamum angolense]|uniref:Uncharacterized protein n=1 Tax=Sesamum angolense TaxID=2727404 RepID=A0AAE2BZ74_9LAMI|nr:hypothetical protein Sango_1056600 [Sesamum angolense]